MTIGITINLKDYDIIWNNGIAQNAINFAILLKNNYNVYLVNTSDINNLKIDGVDIFPIKEKLEELDIIFILGSQIYDEDYIFLKNKGCKIIFYSCGTNYVVDMEEILFRDKTDKRLYKHTPDEIWMIPQYMNTNKYYFQTIYKREVKEIPFIWNPLFINNVIKESNIKGTYTPSDNPKRISCFEPNINIIKYSMYDILITEQAYRKRPDLIKHLYITNSEKIRSNELFVDIMKQLDIVNNGIATFEGRFKMPHFLSEYTDIVITHQWECPLNYAYLEALYLNYPLIHNAHLIKDGGYYYEGFNVEEGSNQLLFALEHHDKNLEEYKDKNKKVIDRYLPTNEKSIEIYNKMIMDLKNK